MSFDDDDVGSSEARHPLAGHPAFASAVLDIQTAARCLPVDERHWQIMEALEVVEATISASTEDSWSARKDGTISAWSHRKSPKLIRKNYGDPYINLADTQSAASGYLNLQFRVDRLDRLIVDMLIAAEMFAYADAPGVQSELTRIFPHPLKWIVSNLTTLVGGSALAGAVLWATSFSTIGGWIAAAIFGLAVLSSAVSLIAFPFYYPQMRKNSAGIRDRLAAMRETYLALDGYPTSVKHVSALIEKAAQSGVIWPSQLYVLLEDIECRRKAI